ncbi:MAG: transcriptional repressor LexA [Peptostreptococcaceae bacterium]|nr:transcriptional repressor LexA [Peptostreptococcaceae bacterium]
MKKSKHRQEAILKYMRETIDIKGYPPTVREICSALNIKSTSTVHSDIKSLIDSGLLIKDPSKPRALKLVEEKSAVTENQYTSNEEIINVPVLGRVAAGTPILASENIEDSFPIPARFVNGGTNFMLTVHGESMINVGINNGDYILVEKNDTARNGEIVVAMVENFESEATVKTFYKENNHFRLQPENDTMSPIIVDDVTIIGKVKGVFRYFN